MVGVGTLLCDEETFIEMEVVGNAKHAWLKTFLKLTHRIPSHDTSPCARGDRSAPITGLFLAMDPERAPDGGAGGGGQRGGCGRKFSCLLAGVLPRHTFTAARFWGWLVELLAGLSMKAAAETLRLPFAPSTFNRLVRQYELLKPDEEASHKLRLPFAKAPANELWQADTL